MKIPRTLFTAGAITLLGIVLTACAAFRKLGEDLKFMDETATVAARITNADDYKNVWGVTINWNQKTNQVVSADFTEVKGVGVFGFFVKKSKNQYLCAYVDRNNDGDYQPGEPAWIHSGADGKPAAVDLDMDDDSRIEGTLSTATVIPHAMITAARIFADGRPDEEVRTGWSIPVDLGEIADLDEPRFSSETGTKSFWQPATYSMDGGIGIYFLEKYDSKRTPVIFVYGAAGSPQDWKAFFNDFDQENFQLWFFEYPSGFRLAESGGALNHGIQLLQDYYGFDRLDVVAHSMGGLVSRYAVLKNYQQGNRYIKHFVTISSPFSGDDFAAMGVDQAPAVIPSWNDMVPDSDFQKEIFSKKLKQKIPYMLLYGDKSKSSLFLPSENDGSVSVKSVTRPEAIKDAVKVQRFNEDHTSILSNTQVIELVEDFLRD